MSRFLTYIHNLRGLAILFVVGVHAGGYEHEWVSHPELNRFLDAFFDPSEGNGTVLFLFIGGFLFQYLTHDRFVYRKYLEAKFLNIILPYILISIPLILIRINTSFQSLSLPDDFQDQPVAWQFVYMLLTGTHMPPFWFISTIILFYIVAPILHRLDNKHFYRYGLPVVIAISLFTYRPEHNANPLLSFIHFIPVYMLGMWASYHRDWIETWAGRLLPAFALVYFAITLMDLTGNLSLSRDITFEYVWAEKVLVFNIYLFKALVLCLGLTMLFYLLRKRSMPLLEILGHYSFGVFFIHYLVISVSRRIVESFGFTFDFSLPIYLAYFVFILATSIGLVYLIKRVAGRYSRYLIGS